MNIDKTNNQTPKLRFVQAKGAIYPNWQQKKLKELAIIISKKNKNGKIIRVLTNSATDGVVDQREYFEKDIANLNNLEGYYIVELGDFVYNPRISNVAPVGPISKNKIGIGVMSPLYTIFRFLNTENDFYEQYFKTTHWHQYLRTASNLGARFDRMSITPKVFMEMPVPFPHPYEQQKIADCLSSIDELIAANIQKLEALKVHKKGLMQQLFPAEGESVPRLRFGEFMKNEEWETKKLGDISEIVRGASPRPIEKFITTEGDGLNWLKIGDVSSGSKYITQTSERVLIQAINFTREISPGDLILSNSMSFGRPYISKIRTCIHDGWIAIRNISDKTSTDFLYYLISSPSSQNYFNINAAGAAVKNLNAEIIKSLLILIPKMDEQQKVAACFSSLDELMEAQEEKVEALKAQKKGLMQQLFPNINDHK